MTVVSNYADVGRQSIMVDFACGSW